MGAMRLTERYSRVEMTTADGGTGDDCKSLYDVSKTKTTPVNSGRLTMPKAKAKPTCRSDPYAASALLMVKAAMAPIPGKT